MNNTVAAVASAPPAAKANLAGFEAMMHVFGARVREVESVL